MLHFLKIVETAVAVPWVWWICCGIMLYVGVGRRISRIPCHEDFHTQQETRAFVWHRCQTCPRENEGRQGALETILEFTETSAASYFPPGSVVLLCATAWGSVWVKKLGHGRHEAAYCLFHDGREWWPSSLRSTHPRNQSFIFRHSRTRGAWINYFRQVKSKLSFAIRFSSKENS